jgi:ABC-type Mn2+/Zn2+ transport system permease subunit
MVNRIAAVVSIFGFLMVFGGVGGIENEGPLMENTIIAIVGLAVMGIGISLIDRRDLE